MIKGIWTAGILLAWLTVSEGRAQAAGYYGLWWDGSAEHFVSIDPFTAAKTDIGVIPGVKYIQVASQIIDSDGGRYAFAGTDAAGAKFYYVIDIATGAVLAQVPQTLNLVNPVYDPALGVVHGLWWSDSSIPGFTDSTGRLHPSRLRGTEYFITLHPDSTVTQTAIPGLKFIAANSMLFDSHGGRYAFSGTDTANAKFYYVIDVATGVLISQIPHAFKFDLPVYNPNLEAAQGLWWSDSSIAVTDSLGRPRPGILKGSEYFVTLYEDSTFTRVEIPGVKWITLYRAFDPSNNQYVFVGKENTGPNRYYVIDADNGALLSQTAAPDKIDNIAYYEPPAGGGGPVALRPGLSNSATARMEASGEHVVLNLGGTNGKSVSFSIRDITGKTLLKREGLREGRVSIETRGLKRGLHLYEVRGGNGRIASGKLLIP